MNRDRFINLVTLFSLVMMVTFVLLACGSDNRVAAPPAENTDSGDQDDNENQSSIPEMTDNKGMVAFTMKRGKFPGLDNYSLWIINTDGSDLQCLATNLSIASYLIEYELFSPNGLYLAYREKILPDELNSDEQYKIITLNGDEKAKGQQTLRYLSDVDRWSSNSSHIIYSRYVDGLYSLYLDGQEGKIYDTKGFTYDHDPVYSPDGSQIAFVHHEYGTNYYIKLMDMDGTNLKTVDDYTNHTNSGSDVRLFLQWFPETTKLIYQLHRRLIVVDLDENVSKEVIRIDTYFNFFKLSPDGKTIVYHANPEFYIADTNTWTANRIIPDSVHSRFPHNFTIVDAAWSSNSDFLIISTSEKLYFVLLDGQRFEIPLNYDFSEGGQFYYYQIGSIDFINR